MYKFILTLNLPYTLVFLQYICDLNLVPQVKNLIYCDEGKYICSYVYISGYIIFCYYNHWLIPICIIAANKFMCIPMLHCIFGLLSLPQHFHNTYFIIVMQTHQIHKINDSWLGFVYNGGY